jgi:TrmH family RNA methyltransferase
MEAPYAVDPPLVVIACDVQDPGNLGALIRVAEAGGASGVVAAGACADPVGWKALRGSMGSALRLPIVTQPAIGQAVAQAKSRGCRVVATAPRDGRSLFLADLKGPLAVLVGSEGSGLPDEVTRSADERISIPMAAPVESLNTAVTAALVVYEAKRQRQ